jgi:hypothetical protein
MGYSAVAMPDILAEAARMTSNNLEESLTSGYSAMDKPVILAVTISNGSIPGISAEDAYLNSSSIEDSPTSGPLISPIVVSAEELSWFGMVKTFDKISHLIK